MSDFPVLVKYYLHHLITARHSKGHGIHSPFVFGLVSEVLFDRKLYPAYETIVHTRQNLLNSKEKLTVNEIGSGSRKFRHTLRPVRDIQRYSSVELKYAQFLYRMVRYYQPGITIELGTSLGFSTLCLCLGNPEGKVISIEGNPGLTDYSARLLQRLAVTNVRLVTSRFENALPDLPVPDLVFIDGNHAYTPTLSYFDHFMRRMKKGIILIDDIHWSAGMHKAWQSIKADERAVVTIDLYRMGIVLTDPAITPGNYTIRF